MSGIHAKCIYCCGYCGIKLSNEFEGSQNHRTVINEVLGGIF